MQPPRPSNKNALLHDTTANEIRMRMEDEALCDEFESGWIVRHELGYSRDERENRAVPDLLCHGYYGDAERIIAMELELHPKSKARYRKLASSYYCKGRADVVWYVVPSRKLGDVIMRAWQNQHSPFWKFILAYSVLDEVLKSPREAKIYFMDGRESTVPVLFQKAKLLADRGGDSPAQGVSSKTITFSGNAASEKPS